MKTSPDVSEMMKQLSAYMATALRKPLPREVALCAKLHLLDALASMISGSRLLPGKRAIDYARTLGGSREASIAGTRMVTTAVNAALINGIFAHADETDDSHAASITHPGASVVPAALALAERFQHDGETLLRAVVLGYDIGTRLMMSLVPLDFFWRGHHVPAFGNVFGAAAAAGALVRLDAERVRYMLSYAAQQAAGLASMLRDPEHMEKAFGMGGMPAHNGVQAALLAAHGFTGVADVFSGNRNFFFTYAPEAKLEVVTHELGKTYEVMNASIKKWPVGAPIVACLDAIETVMHSHQFGSEDVEKVVVTVAEKEAPVVDNRAMPDINLQHLVSLMLLDGRLTFKAAHDFKRMRDPRVVKFKQRIALIGSARLTDVKRRWHAEVEISLRDGRTLKHYTHAARGSSFNPMTPEEENAKALDLLAPVLGKARAGRLIAAVWSIEKLGDMRKFRSLCHV